MKVLKIGRTTINVEEAKKLTKKTFLQIYSNILGEEKAFQVYSQIKPESKADK